LIVLEDAGTGKWAAQGRVWSGLRRLASAAEWWFAGDLASRAPDADRLDSAKRQRKVSRSPTSWIWGGNGRKERWWMNLHFANTSEVGHES
jgi:hypothetical protein